MRLTLAKRGKALRALELTDILEEKVWDGLVEFRRKLVGRPVVTAGIGVGPMTAI